MTPKLSRIGQSLVLATYFRGGSQNQHHWTSNSDQIITISLFYTHDISYDECADRFSNRNYIKCLYDSSGELTHQIEQRYGSLIELLSDNPELIEGGGNFDTPAHPTYTACRLTDAGIQLALSLAGEFPAKPDFPTWPDKRTLPNDV